MEEYIIITEPSKDILKYLDMQNITYFQYNELNDPLKYKIYPPKIRSRL